MSANPVPAPVTRRLILYWGEPPDWLYRGRVKRPADFVRHDITVERRQVAAEMLWGGIKLVQWRGQASCRLCDAVLGSADFGRHGFEWPAGAEHYVLKHDVWTPGLDRLLLAAGA